MSRDYLGRSTDDDAPEIPDTFGDGSTAEQREQRLAAAEQFETERRAIQEPEESGGPGLDEQTQALVSQADDGQRSE